MTQKCPYCGQTTVDGDLLAMHMPPGERRLLLQLLNAGGEFVHAEQLGVPNTDTLKVLISRLRGRLLDDRQPWCLENDGWGGNRYRLRRA